MTYVSRIIAGIILLSALSAVNCGKEESSGEIVIPLPYPDTEEAEFIQAQIDSSEFLWFTDIKATASAFANEFGYDENGVSTTAVRIIGEGIFHGTVEIELSDMILTLTMERPFKHRGKESLWQVTKVEERPWRKQESP